MGDLFAKLDALMVLLVDVVPSVRGSRNEAHLFGWYLKFLFATIVGHIDTGAKEATRGEKQV